MKKLLMLPTWILVRCISHTLPKKNIWGNNKITLTDWAEYSTDLNSTFSMFFWMCGICLFLVLSIFCYG